MTVFSANHWRHGVTRFGAALLMFVCALSLAPRALAATTLEDANRAFANGRYQEAASAFDAIIHERGYSASLLFDLGNAHLRAGHAAEAIVAYRRATVLAPRDPAIAENLARAEAAAGMPGDSSALHRLSGSMTADHWTFIACVAFWLAALGLGGGALYRRRRLGLFRLGAAAGAVCAVSLVALALTARDLHEAIALRATPALVSPFDSAQSSFSLRAGAEVTLGRVHDDYVLVHDPSGKSGWVERQAVAPVIPD